MALETVLSGRNALYAEVNPLARLITRAKTTAPSPEALRQAYSLMRDRSATHFTDDIPDVVNAELWYAEEIFRCLAQIKSAIQLEQNPTCREALLIAFSVVTRKVSRADPRFSVPVRRKVATSSEPDRPGHKEASEKIWKIFDWQISANIKRYKELEHLLTESPRIRYVGPDSRALRLFDEGECGTLSHSAHMPESFVDLIITSPPYVSAQKYVRATSLNLGWLDLAPSKGLSALEQRTIGREHIRKSASGIDKITFADAEAVNFVHEVAAVNPARAAITLTYLSEMNAAVAEMARVLRPGGYAVVVIGDNLICGRKFETTHFIKHMFEAQSCDLRLHLTDRIPSRGLMTKRNGTAAVIAEESILVFHKRRSWWDSAPA